MTPSEYLHSRIQEEARDYEARMERLTRFAPTEPLDSFPAPIQRKPMTQWEWEAYCDEQDRLNREEDENAWRGGWADDWRAAK